MSKAHCALSPSKVTWCPNAAIDADDPATVLCKTNGVLKYSKLNPILAGTQACLIWRPDDAMVHRQ